MQGRTPSAPPPRSRDQDRDTLGVSNTICSILHERTRASDRKRKGRVLTFLTPSSSIYSLRGAAAYRPCYLPARGFGDNVGSSRRASSARGGSSPLLLSPFLSLSLSLSLLSRTSRRHFSDFWLEDLARHFRGLVHEYLWPQQRQCGSCMRSGFAPSARRFFSTD